MYKFFGGMIFLSGITSLIRACYGKAKYVSICEKYWVDSSITIPLALLVIVFGLLITFKKDR